MMPCEQFVDRSTIIIVVVVIAECGFCVWITESQFKNNISCWFYLEVYAFYLFHDNTMYRMQNNTKRRKLCFVSKGDTNNHAYYKLICTGYGWKAKAAVAAFSEPTLICYLSTYTHTHTCTIFRSTSFLRPQDEPKKNIWHLNRFSKYSPKQKPNRMRKHERHLMCK